MPDPDSDLVAWRAWADNRDRWAESNPALGIRITEEAVETELGRLQPSDFARERLGLFPDQLDDTERLIGDEDWAGCERSGSKIAGPLALAVEVSADRRWATVAASGSVADGVGLHVEVVEHRRYTGWVPARLVELRDRHRPVAIVVNPSGPAGALVADIEAAGVVLVKASGRDLVAACGAALDEIVEHRWRHIGQPVLNLAVAEAGRRTVGDAWVFDRRGAADVSALVAVTLAAWGARSWLSKDSVYEERGLLVL